ncbi:hypothetical protein HY839_01015 [Candidatus Azambacteria bacterium]|nr:hypothetical protein [Candidatus Azambacteria bacterium]
MIKIDLKKIKELNWILFFKQNKYSFISLFMLALYFYATFFAVVFIVKNARHAFDIDEQAAERTVVTFDTEGYASIARRFGHSTEPKN